MKVIIFLLFLSFGRIKTEAEFLFDLIHYKPEFNLKEQPHFEDYWFSEQRQDHFDPNNNNTWKQHYLVNWPNSSAQLGGPIFLNVFGEYMANFHTNPYAARYDAIQIILEHRYYGFSFPTPNTTLENLKYLTTEQALEDVAHFIQYFNKKHSLGNRGNKWILFGASYSGALVAYFRLKYPHLTIGAVANSAPVEAKYDFYEFNEVVQNALGQNCSSVIQDATNEYIGLIKNGTAGRRELERIFNVCDLSHLNTPMETSFFALISYISFYGQQVQEWSNEHLHFLCGRILDNTNLTSPLERIVAVQEFSPGHPPTECQNATTYKYYIHQLTSITDNSWQFRLWLYQLCTQYAFFYNTNSPHQPFGDLLPNEFHVQRCADTFGSRFTADYIQKAVNETNLRYGGKNIANVVTNVFFTNSLSDPWHPLGILEPPKGNPTVRVKVDKLLPHTVVSAETKKEISDWIGQLLGRN